MILKMKTKMKKSTIVAIVAAGAVLLGGLIAFTLYLRAKARDLSERLDFDSDFYDEEDSLFDSPMDEDEDEFDVSIASGDATEDSDATMIVNEDDQG